MSHIPNDLRDMAMSAYREEVCRKMGLAPFLHQREVWAASDGLELTGDLDDENGLPVQIDSSTVVKVGYVSRPHGRARFLSDLGSFKIGKSFGAALWACGFAAVPNAVVNLVGLEYDICEPEFNYIVDFLLTERGMGLKYESLAQRARDGKMWLDLENGAKFVCRSWERKDTLKGKEIDAYIYCEAYQLPGIECFTSFSQNLRARRGYAYFATTPDRPWVKLLHDLGHGTDPEWHCTCSIPADVNPFTFDPKAKERDVKLMTKEKFAIHYEGQLGDFVGRVFNYAKGSRTFNASTHPQLFDGGISRADLKIPQGWEIVSGCDTGTFYSALVVAFDPEGTAFVIDEFPNYRYIAGEPERDEQLSIPRWANNVRSRIESIGGRANLWADPNSQFKGELRNYGLNLLPARVPVETRTEIAREYFEHNRIFFAPWLSELPFEIENAAWPEEATASGKFARIKLHDHILDPLEHVLARRPLGRHHRLQSKPTSWAESMGYKKGSVSRNIHLGRQ